MTVHLVYPCDNPAQTPGAIGWHLAKQLEQRFGSVECHAWDEFRRLRPSKGDMLIGHLHPLPGTTMKRSLKEPGWHRRVLLNPFNFDVAQVGFLEPWLSRVDALIAICGPEWSSRLDFSYFSHWGPKFVPVDLGIDVSYFPYAPSGDTSGRGLLYIGHRRWYKNTAYLESMATYLPDFDLAWIGGQGGLRGWRPLGHIPLSSPIGREMLHGFRASVTAGSFDANPTTVLESMALGLLPFTTPTSGWSEEQGAIHIPTWSPEQAASRIRDVFDCNPSWWEARLLENRQRAERTFTWDRFCSTVIRVLEDPPNGSVGVPHDSRRRIITLGSLASPMLRRQMLPQHVARGIRRLARPVMTRPRAISPRNSGGG